MWRRLGDPCFTHAPLANATAHRMAGEDVHLSKCPLKLLGLKHEVGDGTSSRRFSISRLIHGIGIKTSGGERLAETKQHLFRAAVSMSEERNGMRTRRYGANSKRGCVPSQHYLFEADPWLDYERQYGANDQGGDVRRNYPGISASSQ